MIKIDQPAQRNVTPWGEGKSDIRCSSCRWFRWGGGLSACGPTPCCDHELARSDYDASNGRWLMTLCREARAIDGICGVEAKLYEPRPTVWARLKSTLRLS